MRPKKTKHTANEKQHRLKCFTNTERELVFQQPMSVWAILKSQARYWMLGASALGRPRGMVWGGRREEGSGWGTHVYLWRIHFDIWQN